MVKTVLIIEHIWVSVEQCYEPTRQPGIDHHVSFKAVPVWMGLLPPPVTLSVGSLALTPSSCMSLDMELCHVLCGQPTSVAPPTIYVGTTHDPVGILLSLHMTEPPQPVPPQYGADPLHSDSPPQLLT